MTTVYKYGGAAIQDAAAIRRLGEKLQHDPTRPLVVVVSAMGKTTNALEALLAAARCGDDADYRTRLEQLRHDHLATAEALFGDRDAPVTQQITALVEELDRRHWRYRDDAREVHYDQTIGFGELLSTTLIAAWLNDIGVATEWRDARELVITDDCHQAANIDWEATTARIRGLELDDQTLVVTQGFIAATAAGTPTTLGREGSDYSAAIFAHCLDADNVVIWKDVPGLFNADPRRFANAVQLKRISYDEAIELAWHGAKVIHPKTLAPLREKAIPLAVRSFEALDAPPSLISAEGPDTPTPAFIVTDDQVLLEIHPRDFAFMDEPRLHDVFGRLAETGLHASLVDTAATRLSLCLNLHPERLDPLIASLAADYALARYDRLTLLTVRHPTNALLSALSDRRTILAERRNATTAQRLFLGSECPATWRIPE